MVAGSVTAARNRRSGTRNSSADGQEHQQCECNQRDIQRQQQLAEIDQYADSHLADSEGHRCADADGGEVHDDVGELEHDLGEA